MRLTLDIDSFLAEYWQRKPLYIAAGIVDFTPPADADELAGLAMESGVDSQIIRRTPQGWEAARGPFGEDAFAADNPWTLLVQSVDQYWDEAAELLHLVPELPSWRVDNVMMSYASDDGSAGPHFDQYDVFIIQGAGERLWQLGQHCTDASPLLPLEQLRLLQHFEVKEEYRMRCGDVLYIPPGCAHYGRSIGESTSFSLGFRAPRLSDLLARWTDLCLETLGDHQLFSDPGRSIAGRRGELEAADVERARQQLRQLLEAVDSTWMGEALTAGPAGDEGSAAEPLPDGEDWVCARNPSSRIAWFADRDAIVVFANGNSLRVSTALQPLIERLCGDESLAASEALRTGLDARALLVWLNNEDSLLVDG